MSLTSKVREALLRLRVLRVPAKVEVSPYSNEYLYLVQQGKRLGLSHTLARFRLKNIPTWPVIFVVALWRYIDLKITNALIQSIINENELIRRIEAR
jgi:hypothetical protein